MSNQKTMLAYRVHEFGAPEVIKAEQVELPVPGPGEVLVKVHAAGVGPWDGWIRSGNSALPQPLPLTLGSDLSGVVETIGPDVDGFEAGDEVYGVTNPRFIGSYAEYAIAQASMIGHKPKKIDHVEAASIPVIASTARQALFEQAGLKAGQTVLIHGAAGNVGAYAVQFAHKAGLRVVATADARDIETVRNLGADQVIDYQKERFEDVVKNVDAVIDLVGGETQTKSFAVLKRGGKLISAVSKPDQEVAASFGVSASFFLVAVNTRELNEIAESVDDGSLKTKVGTVLPLTEAISAHEMLEGTREHAKGKIVLKVD
ncbi:NADP-dependent oxidoreductase [Rhizobium sp. 2MFCol3.1]|uniref:NADP-dependent oxidoreductase n=1 Tax=Rhizobium sp. 2MFCol3.1 TaxID=1246459 RepID=UPI000380902D|nr:NADP-dependent oxidoreductase [Rhizobium sp. 2MFCol3.1]